MRENSRQTTFKDYLPLLVVALLCLYVVAWNVKL